MSRPAGRSGELGVKYMEATSWTRFDPLIIHGQCNSVAVSLCRDAVVLVLLAFAHTTAFWSITAIGTPCWSFQALRLVLVLRHLRLAMVPTLLIKCIVSNVLCSLDAP